MIKDSIKLFILKLTAQSIGFLLNVYLSHVLPVVEYAKFGKFLTYSGYFSNIMLLGLPIALLVEVKSYKELLGFVRVIISLFFSVIFLLFVFIVGMSNYSGSGFYFLIALNALLLSLISIMNSCYQYALKFNKIGLIQFFQIFLIFIFIVCLSVEFKESNSSFFYILIPVIVNAMIAFYMMYDLQIFPYRIALRDLFSLFNIGKIGTLLALQVTLQQILYLSDFFIIDIYFNDQVLKAYYNASLLVKVIILFIDSIGTVFLGILIAEDLNGQVRKLAFKKLKRVFFFFVLLSIIIFLFSLEFKFIFEFLFNDRTEITGKVFAIMSLCVPALFGYKMLNRIYAVLKEFKKIYLSLFLSIVLNVVFCWISASILRNFYLVALFTVFSYWFVFLQLIYNLKQMLNEGRRLC